MFDPRLFFATGFYSGYFPVAPGTAGTVVAALIYALQYLIFGNNAVCSNIAIAVLSIYPAIKCGDHAEKIFGRKDPGEVVVDEFVGYWISVMFHPFSWTVVVLGFIFFRVTDILKPYPANRLQSIKGGAGILIDDCVAGVYANLMLILAIFTMKFFNIPIL